MERIGHDWRAVARVQEQALLRLAAMLVAMLPAGAATLPWSLRLRVLRLLRPAESATRRLIVAMATMLPAPEVALRPARPRRPLPSAKAQIAAVRPWRHGRGVAAQLANLRRLAEAGQLSPRQARDALAALLGTARPAQQPQFRLLDRRKRFALRDRRRAALRTPRISVPGVLEMPIRPEAAVPDPARPVPVGSLGRRIAALADALADMPAQAARMARREVRREMAASVGTAPLPLGPLRPGWPPGHRQRARHAIDHVLDECHRLARWAQESRAPP